MRPISFFCLALLFAASGGTPVLGSAWAVQERCLPGPLLCSHGEAGIPVGMGVVWVKEG